MATTACPICFRHVRADNLALHVESCLNATEAKAQATANANTSINSMMRSPSPSARAPPQPQPTRKRARNGAADEQRSAKMDATQTLTTPQGEDAEAVAGETDLVRTAPPRRRLASSAPLAERMRPMKLTEFVGQDDVLAPGTLLHTLIESDRVPNMILWGPPGCGKTTLATIVSRRTSCKFIKLSGATSSATDMRKALETARGQMQLCQRRTIVFVDELHRFKKNQQDFFLPPVEDGTFTFIGATTENPSFTVNNALLSRCRVYTLKQLSLDALRGILERALQAQSTQLRDADMLSANGNGHSDSSIAPIHGVRAEEAALAFLAAQANGDARVALSGLEMAVQTANELDADGWLVLNVDHVRHCISQRHALSYDRNGDFHYDLISAFHKSIRGSDANAALYWLARMLEGGEDPLYVARRMIRIAAEDVGLAAPHLLPQSVAAYQAAQSIGMPECDVVLAQCATQLARAPKSVEVYKAYKRVKQSIREWDRGVMPDVPLHLRNAPTKLMDSLGYGQGYLYNPDYTPEETKHQTYLPTVLLGTDFFADKTIEADDQAETKTEAETETETEKDA